VGQHYLPHDVEVRELGTGKSRKEVLEGLGIKVTVCPNIPIADGIQAVRMLLPTCWFDKVKCKDGVEALRMYRREYDEKRQEFKPHPLHDWTSHYADALRYFAVGHRKPFSSSDETVVFEPRSEEDEEVAQQATEYVNYVLHSDNNGFLIFHDWFKDALLQKLGVVKLYWEDRTREKIVRLEKLDPAEIQLMGPSVKDVYGPDEDGLYTADVSMTDPDGKLCIENIPPEEYRISPLSRPGQVPPYEAHVTRKSRSELIEMGFDRKIVMGLSKSSQAEFSDTRAIARRQDEQEAGQFASPAGGEANQLVDFNDEFVLVDYDGDGIAELRRVMRSDKTVLYNEEIEFSLFARLCPVPMPHKVYGQGLADQVMDEQRISTALWRQTLDNLYLANNPRPTVGQGAERDSGITIDDILSDAPGAIIRAKDVTQLGDFSVPFVADKSFPMLAYVEQQAEARTGISKQGQGMDPDALDTSGQITATQSAIMEEGRNSRSEMIARIFGETGVKDLFRIMLKLLVQHQPKARMIRLRNKWVEMDPRQWNAEMDVSISVGLGTGSKAQQLMTSQTILEGMKELALSPFATLIDKEKVANAWKKFLNASGVKNVDDYMVEPQRDEQGNIVPDPPQPNPEQMKMQAQMQIEGMKAQMQAQASAQQQQQQAAETIAKLHLEQAKNDAKMQLEQTKAAFEAQLAQQKFEFEARLAAREAATNEAIAQRDAERNDRVAEAKVSQNRPGGDLSE
jgi:hypothetical protein